MIDIAGELFAPSHRHMREERERLELVIDDVGTSDPARGPIDLASGKVVLRLPEQGQQGHEGAEGGEDAEDAVGATPLSAP